MKQLALLWLMMMGLSLPSFAAYSQNIFGDQSPDGDLPPLELPPILEAEEAQAPPSLTQYAQQAQGYFPALPPSRLCTKQDVLGFWKLAMVHELPAGQELRDFAASPYQYTIFNPDDTIRMYKSVNPPGSDVEVLNRMRDQQSNVLEQYVVHESGIVYYYKNGAALDSLACFIAAESREPFVAGQMLFMPTPDRAATVRMVKAYQKVFSAPAQNQKKQKAKRKRNRKR